MLFASGSGACTASRSSGCILREEVTATTTPSDEALVVARHVIQKLGSCCAAMLTREGQRCLEDARGIVARTHNLNR